VNFFWRNASRRRAVERSERARSAAAVKLTAAARRYLKAQERAQRRMVDAYDAHIDIPQGYWGVVERAWIGTFFLETCIGLVARDPTTYRTFVGHLDDIVSEESIGDALVEAFPAGSQLDVTLIGGGAPHARTVAGIHCQIGRVRALGYTVRGVRRLLVPNPSITSFSCRANPFEILWKPEKRAAEAYELPEAREQFLDAVRMTAFVQAINCLFRDPGTVRKLERYEGVGTSFCREHHDALAPLLGRRCTPDDVASVLSKHLPLPPSSFHLRTFTRSVGWLRWSLALPPVAP
jgi:hypothetical protein